MIRRGPANRKPVWVGGCGGARNLICVIDEIPGDPASREVATYSSDERTFRAKAPHAAVPGVFARGSDPSAAGWVFAGTTAGPADGPITKTVVAGVTTDPRTFDGTMFRLNGGNAVVLSGPPSGAAADWTTTPQRITVRSVHLGDGKESIESTITARTATCDADYYVLACASESDTFTVWKVKVP
jgi:hypothetical protein